MYFLEKVNSGDKKVTRATLFAKKLIAKSFTLKNVAKYEKK